MMKNIFTSKQMLVRLAYAMGVLSLVLAVALSLSAGETLAANLFATAPGLGVAGSFAVLGGSTVTNTGATVVNGDLGVSPGSAVTGFPPGIVNGTFHVADAVALNAQNDVTTAYNILAGQPCDENLTGQDLGGKTLTPGVYCFDSSAQLTGTLKLDAQGDEWSVFIFQIGSTLTTASSSSVEIINADKLCNVFWQVGSSATLGTTTAFKGNILALESITLNTGATVIGRALARNAALTMDTNIITIPVCALASTPTATATTTSTTTSTTEPTTGPTTAPTTAPTAAPTTAPTTAPTAEPTAEPTKKPTAKPTTAPETLPDTGGDLAEPESQLIRNSLGALGLTLILIGFMLSRSIRKPEK